MWTLDLPLPKTDVIRFDTKKREGLEKLGLATVGDLLKHYPRRYEDRTRFDLFPEGPMAAAVCLHVEVTDCQSRFGRGRGRRYFEVIVEPLGGGDALGNRIALRWFNLSYIQKIITVGHHLVIFGQPKLSGRKLVIDHPDFEIVEEESDAPEAHMGRIVPIYPLVDGLSQKAMRTLVFGCLRHLSDEAIPEWLPPGSSETGLTRALALREIHYPPSLERVEEARRYLALEEFTRLQVILQKRRADHRRRGGVARVGSGELVGRFLHQLGFEPTGAQHRTIREIHEDLAAAAPMMRLLQGDVGAGKTLVAAAAILTVLEAGYDAALMAPTQILAEQHYLTFQAWFDPLDLVVRLKTGSRDTGTELPLFSRDRTGGDESETAARRPGNLTIGTHALIHEEGSFSNGLGLAVIDEQHKFGVDQREALIRRGDATDVLAMTATPIPRTLALAFYGDLDLSVLDELPPGRGRIVTGIRLTTQTRDATDFLRTQIQVGRQIYVVYPLIDESENVSAGAASAEFAAWRERLPEARLALLHGRLSPREKDAVMKAFREGEADVLVSTTVIEVGVDVPNANVMLIYHAERFGLAQLHQLRGRIGRGSHKSFCVLMIDPAAEQARERLAILEETRDGFRIAEEDLRQRGAGEVLGTRQSGLADLKFGDFIGDTALVEKARELAGRICASTDSGRIR